MESAWKQEKRQNLLISGEKTFLKKKIRTIFWREHYLQTFNLQKKFWNRKIQLTNFTKEIILKKSSKQILKKNRLRRLPQKRWPRGSSLENTYTWLASRLEPFQKCLETGETTKSLEYKRKKSLNKLRTNFREKKISKKKCRQFFSSDLFYLIVLHQKKILKQKVWTNDQWGIPTGDSAFSWHTDIQTYTQLLLYINRHPQ